jgi:hypothetical protein
MNKQEKAKLTKLYRKKGLEWLIQLHFGALEGLETQGKLIIKLIKAYLPEFYVELNRNIREAKKRKDLK